MNACRTTIVGLVGMIGSGKTTVARRLGQLGAEVIDADQLAHHALDDAAVRQQLRERFGPDIFTAEGRVDRKLLARLVFGADSTHQANLAAVEAMVHPWVRTAIDTRLVAAVRPPSASSVIVLDVPLLVQAGWHTRCDRLICLECDDSVRHARLAARGLSPADIAAREAAWRAGFDAAALAERPGWTVDTAGDLAYTQGQVDRVWQELSSR